MQKVLSSLLLISGLCIAFSGAVAHADGPSLRDMYSKMGFGWGDNSGSHGQWSGNSGTQHQYDQSGGDGQSGHSYSCSHASGSTGQQPPEGQPTPSETLRKALELNPPIYNVPIDNSVPTTTTPGT